MLIFFSFGYRTVKSFGTFLTQKCNNCNNNINSELLKVTTWFTLFFIPIIPYRKEYLIVCPICKDALKISKVDFEQIIGGNSSNLQGGSIIGKAISPNDPGNVNISPQNKYAGKTETQIAYLKQMEEFENQRANHQE